MSEAELFSHKVATKVLDCLKECATEHPELGCAVVSLGWRPEIGEVQPNLVILGDMTTPGVPILALRGLLDAVETVHDYHGKQVAAGLHIIQTMEEQLGQHAEGEPDSSGGSVPPADPGDDRPAGGGDAS